MKVLKCLSQLRYICAGCFLGGLQKRLSRLANRSERVTSVLFGVTDGESVKSEDVG